MMFNLFKKKMRSIDDMLQYFGKHPQEKWPNIIKSYKGHPNDHTRNLLSFINSDFEHIKEHIKWTLESPESSEWFTFDEAKELVARFPVFGKTREKLMKEGLNPSEFNQISAENKLAEMESSKPMTPTLKKKIIAAGGNPEDFPDRASARSFITAQQ